MRSMAVTATRPDFGAASAELERLCARFGVRRLELFGSAATGPFDPARSDIDFLVDLGAVEGMTPFAQYFGLKESLEALFGRAVDLVMAGANTNPWFIESVNRTRQLIYAAPVQEAA